MRIYILSSLPKGRKVAVPFNRSNHVVPHEPDNPYGSRRKEMFMPENWVSIRALDIHGRSATVVRKGEDFHLEVRADQSGHEFTFDRAAYLPLEDYESVLDKTLREFGYRTRGEDHLVAGFVGETLIVWLNADEWRRELHHFRRFAEILRRRFAAQQQGPTEVHYTGDSTAVGVLVL